MLRGGLGVVGIVVAAMLTSCSSLQPAPSKEHPMTGCHISCVNVMGVSHTEHRRPSFRAQKLCAPGLSRQFQDLLIWGEDKARHMWLTLQGDYLEEDVVLTPCDNLVRQEQSKMDASERGQLPGEDDLGHPKH